MTTKNKTEKKPAAKAPTGIQITTGLHIERLTIPVLGSTPLLMHRFSDKARAEIELKQGATGAAMKAKKAPRNPREEYEGCFYTNSRGEIVFPATAFKNAIQDACRQLANVKATVVAGAIHMTQPEFRIYGTPRFVTHMARLESGVFCPRYRPQFDKWGSMVTLEFNGTVLNAEAVVNLLSQAGFSCGIGDWRPFSKTNRSGSYGRFAVVNADNAELRAVMAQPQSTKAPENVDLEAVEPEN